MAGAIGFGITFGILLIAKRISKNIEGHTVSDATIIAFTLWGCAVWELANWMSK